MYKKTQLRSSFKPLLKRLQRQLDKKISKKETISLIEGKGKVGLSKLGIPNLDIDEEFVLKKSKLDLYNRRRGR
jgi:predicted component of type VI protein secretion system